MEWRTLRIDAESVGGGEDVPRCRDAWRCDYGGHCRGLEVLWLLSTEWSIGRTNHVVDGIDSRWEPKGGVVKRAEEAIAQSKPEPDSLELDAGFSLTMSAH